MPLLADIMFLLHIMHIPINHSVSLSVNCPFFQVPYAISEPRSGDVASCYADPKLAAEELKWKAERGLDEMCKCLAFLG